jgi:hypothetical protein
MPGFGSLIGLGRVAIPIAAIALFVFLVIEPRDAAAKQTSKCVNPSLLRADEKRLVAAARGVLPPDLEPLVSGQCRWAESAFARITTEKTTEDDGITHWWISSCSRDARDWTCRPAKFEEEIETHLVVGIAPIHVKIRFDEDMTPQVAKALASQALTIYANPSPPLPYCGGFKGQESKWSIFRGRHPLPMGNKVMNITVDSDSQTPRVWFDDRGLSDDFQITIDFPPSDEGPPTPCWSVWMS